MSDSHRHASAPASDKRPAGFALLLSFPVLGVLLAVCYAAAMARDFEFDIGHFVRGSVFFHLAAAFGVIGALLAVGIAAFTAGRTAFTELPRPTPLSVFGGALGAILSVALFMQNLLGYRAALAAEETESLSPAKLFLASAVIGLFLAAALILSLSAERRHRWYALICTLLGAFSVNVAMFAAYFDFTVPLNSPVRNFTTVCQASVLLFLLGEARISLTAEDTVTELPPAFQLFTSGLCALFGIGVGGGGALWQILRSFSFGSEIVTKTPEPNLPAIRLALYFAVGVIAADRLLRTSLRRLTADEIAENKRKAKEEKEKSKKKYVPGDGDSKSNNNS
ncbi:MAG: hypothetical protein E7576_05680 [Ruminococcaceae bacterium]|jgi:hypothetical protein|nr:hypothetical protein [Oscillospiraceae bacterium]